MTVTFFGHKDTPKNTEPTLRTTLIDLIENHNAAVFCVGNNGNFDTMVRRQLENLSQTYPITYNIVLAYIPTKKSEYDSFTNTLLPEGIETIPNSNKRDKEYLLSILKFMIKRFQFVFKNKSFSYEKEIRAILHIPKTEKSIEGKISERKYRQSNGLIVPYVKYNIDKIHVKSITLAPTIKEQTAINNLEDYLCSKNMNHVNIIASDIPIRSV